MPGLCYLVGMNEKVPNTGEPINIMPIFFLGVFVFFFQRFFQIQAHPRPSHGL